MAITRRTPNRLRARITSQGQITVPKAVRDELSVEPGDELEFEITEGSAVVHPRRRRSVLDFAGVAGERSRLLPRTATELDEVLAAAHAKRVTRRHGR